MYLCEKCGHNNGYFVRFKFNPGRDSSIVPCGKCGSEMVGETYYYSYVYVVIFHFVCINLIDSKDSLFVWIGAIVLNMLILYITLPLKSEGK